MGKAAQNTAPNLYAKAIRKQITMQLALKNNRWVQRILPISSDIEVIAFLDLWQAIQGVQMNEELEDQISWRWTKDGECTTHSAYNIQFLSSSNKLRPALSEKLKLNADSSPAY